MRMILLEVEVEAWSFSTLKMALYFGNKDSHIKCEIQENFNIPL